nr:HNH endonuclease [Vibrio maerlii]
MLSIELAKKFVLESVLQPAIDDHRTSEKVKNVTKSQIPWINGFRKVGDIYKYLLSTTKSRDGSVDEIEQLGLKSYEQILPDFEKKFKHELNDLTSLDEFVIDNEYSSREFLPIVGRYDTRSGGILPYFENGQLKSILVKVTFEGGKYKNQWLIENKLLKYFMKSIGDVFKDDYKENQAIINSGSVPIFVFTRQTNDESKFKFKGAFKYLNHFDEGNAKWFQLGALDLAPKINQPSEIQVFNQSVTESLKLSSDKRKKRLAKASKKPKRRVVHTYVYDRNPDVVAEVLNRAMGYCESCNSKAPFEKRTDGQPFLEVHHRIRLADGGDDTVENAIALCPNCHRKEHFG